jgi:tRNA nucleotidyltransferase (CCA-adding enzyme)
MTEEELINKLKKIERLFAGAQTDGEREAAKNASDRIRSRLKSIAGEEATVEYKFTFADMWSRKLFSALLRRYDLKPYRYKRQRHTTVMVKVPVSFVDQTLWPEFQELDEVLKNYISNITDKIIQNHIHNDSSEASVVQEPEQLE